PPEDKYQRKQGGQAHKAYQSVSLVGMGQLQSFPSPSLRGALSARGATKQSRDRRKFFRVTSAAIDTPVVKRKCLHYRGRFPCQVHPIVGRPFGTTRVHR